jgi:serine/threonine-protein kinase
MKRCPHCRRDYYDDSLRYCLDDGTALIEGPASFDSAATRVLPASFDSSSDVDPAERSFGAECRSIAVLPFVNVSPDSENEYFCDGLAEDLLNALAKIEDLKVAARTSAFSFKGKNAGIGTIARALGVATIVEGSVRKLGERVRISVQVVNAADGYQIWSDRYDRDVGDIFELQDEITLAVVDALKITLFADEQEFVLKRYTKNAQAYEEYLQGRYFYNKWTRENFGKAIEHCERAIAIDPEFALAYATIGFCYGALFYFGALRPHNIVPKWRDILNRALEIDPGLADAHLSMTSIQFYYDWNTTEAERSIAHARRSSPNNADIYWRWGHILAALGRFDEALGECRLAIGLDPLSIIARFFNGRVLTLAGRMDEALAEMDKIIEIEPSFSGAYTSRGMVLVSLGKYDEAIESLDRSLELGSFAATVLSYKGVVYALRGETDRAEKVLAELSQARERSYVTPVCFARILAALGDIDKAFEWLDSALDERNGELVFLKAETGIGWYGPLLAKDPRFAEFIDKIGPIEVE